MKEEVTAYLDALEAERRPLFDRVHRLISVATRISDDELRAFAAAVLGQVPLTVQCVAADLPQSHGLTH